MKRTLQSQSPTKRGQSKRVWLILLVTLLAAAGGAGGYLWWSQQTTTAASAQAEDGGFKTTQVRKGSITLSTSGAGTLIAGKEANLAFSAAGSVAEVHVTVGDVVAQGDVLAKLGDLEELQAGVASARQELAAAQEALKTLKVDAAANLANAELSLADAQDALADAKSAVVQPGWSRCDQDTVDAYYYNYTHAQDSLTALGDGGGNKDYYLKVIVPAKNAAAQAYAAYVYCAGYSDTEIASSKASFALAEAELITAQNDLETLKQHDGIEPLALASAENKVANAEFALRQAEDQLDGATITAPFAGTVLAVAGSVGDTVGTGTFITLADLAHPQIEFSADETDLSLLSIGEQAVVTFDAVPDRTFSGTVTRINPALETVSGYQVITGLIQLDLSAEESALRLPKGLNATVELVQATANDVLVVPVQAVRDLGDNTYSVFVVDANGTPKMRVVEVGIMDAASAEIKSGVSLGDVVTTGITETK